MPRFFKKMSLKDFEEKLTNEWKIFSENKERWTELPDGFINHEILRLSSKIERDLNKVDFSSENFSVEKFHIIDYNKITRKGKVSDDPENRIMGFCTLPNGMPFLGMWAGGDWEKALFMLIYYSGKEFRGYIPKNGNTWNTTNNKAYCNDPELDLKDIRKRFGIKIKLDNIDDFESSDIPDWDVGKIIDDIQKRILPKE